MDEEESNLQDTIENDMRNRNQGPVREKLEKEAKKKARQAAKKARDKMKSTLFKKVGLTSFIGFLPLIIIVFMIVGIISFVTSMPGLVQEEIMSKLMDITGGFKYWANGSDQYLVDLAKDSDRKNQKEILMYLDDMGMDPVGFGFATFYTRAKKEGNKSTDVKDIDYETSIKIDQKIKQVNGLFSAVEYNNKQTKERLKEDLILKYLISNERTYLIHDNDKFGNTSLGQSIPSLNKLNLSGMIVTKIDGIDDSEITVDREKKQMVITSKNWGFLSVTNQVARYNLESWSGRYGMSLEFLLALHIGTMTSDLTDEMLGNENLQTTMYVASKKGDYDVDYEITYKGKDLEDIKRGKGSPNYDLINWKGGMENYIVEKSDGTYGIDVSDDELSSLKNAVSINSVYEWYKALQSFNLRYGINQDFIERSTYDAKDAFLGDGRYRVLYRVQSNYYTDANWKNTSWFGNVEDLDSPSHPTWKYSWSFPTGDDYSKNQGFYGGIQDSTHSFEMTDDAVYFLFDMDSNTDMASAKREVCFSMTSEQPNALLDEYYMYDSVIARYNTAILHGIQYYLDGHEEEVRQEYVRYGIICLLSQLDSYLYRSNLENMSSEISFTKYDNGYTDSDEKHWDIPLLRTDSFGMLDHSELHLLITEDWIEFWENNDNPTTQQIHDELEHIATLVNDYFEMLDHKNEHIQEIIDDMFEKVGIKEKLTISDINIIHDALENNSDEFEFVLPRITSVQRHWYKDILFDSDISGYDAYERNNDPLRYPLTLNEENKDLEVTAVLTYISGSGDGPYKQVSEPLVIKGDVVTLDGEQVPDDVAEQALSKGKGGYEMGDGYRTTKKLFTQGQYYTFDGSRETAKSNWYAKQLETLNGSDKIYAKAIVQNGRLILSWVYDGTDQPAEFSGAYLGNNQWDLSKQQIVNERASESICLPKNAVKVAGSDEGDWSVFLSMATVSANTNLPANIYYIVCNTNMEYKSAADDVEESKASVKRINALLEAMGVVTTRKQISFDNTTVAGDVITLTAFGLLEGMHTEAAECIYRDLKEFLIELGYYTKAEFEVIEANQLEWFIPDYKPSTSKERKQWNQATEADSLKYGAILYPTEIDSDGKVVKEGFDADLDVIAPGNCKVMELNDHAIKIEFDGMSQPEIGALDKYTMIIDGIDISENPVKVITPDGNAATKSLRDIVGTGDVIEAGEVIGKTGTTKIQVILKNRIGGYVSDIQDYMAPESDAMGTLTTQKYKFSKDEITLLAYVINQEAAPEGLVQYMDTSKSVYDTPEEQAQAYARAVGYVLVNRALQNYGGYGETIEAQSSNPTQYSSGYTIAKAKAADQHGKISIGSKEAAEHCAKYGCESVVNPDGEEMTEDVTGESAWTFGHKIFWWLDTNQNGKQDIYATSRNEATADKPYPVAAYENPNNYDFLQAWPWDGYLTYSN